MGNSNGCCETKGDMKQAEVYASSDRQVYQAMAANLASPEKPQALVNRSFSDDDDHHNAEDEIKKKLEKKKGANKKKLGISAEAYGTYNKVRDFRPPVVAKTPEQAEQIRGTLQKSFMFNGLEEKDQRIVIDAMSIKNYRPGDFVIRQGDEGNELYIVANGALRCEKVFPGKTEPTFLKNYQPNEVFGELSLLYNTPRAASIISTTESRLFSLDRETFNHIVKTSAIRKRELYEAFLKKLEILKYLDDYDRSKLCDVLKTETFSRGQDIIRQGDDADKFFILQEGVVETYKREGGQPEKLVYTFKENDYFGELALITNDKRQASCRVASDKAVVASLDRDSFNRLLGPIHEVIAERTKRYNIPKR